MSNVSIDLDRVRSYNSKCNDYKKKLSNILAERKFMAERLEQLRPRLVGFFPSLHVDLPFIH